MLLGRGDYLSSWTRWIGAVLYRLILVLGCAGRSTCFLSTIMHVVWWGRGGGIGLITIIVDKRFRLWIYLSIEGHPLPKDIFREHLELRGFQDLLPEHLYTGTV